MSDSTNLNGYTATIGIECHVQLKTKTKLFAGVINDARDADPNTLISPLCLGMPGSLPVLNQKAVDLAIVAASALGTRAQVYSKFDRKHYFYPDLPLGYQISQFDEPIILGGFVDIELSDQTKRINLTRAHLEADAGKSTHLSGADYSLVDLNRAGTPLLEIVSEPEMHTPEEARAYAQALHRLMKYANVSDVDLYHGNMRFDVNVSVSKTDELGTRTETKNLNSFRSVEKAVDYEISRQIKQLDSGLEIVQETRGWDDDKQQTFSQRTKEDAHDYRYFPDPDLPPIELTDKYIDEIVATVPAMPEVYRRDLAGVGMDSSQLEIILEEPDTALFVSQILKSHGDKTTKTIINWLTSEITKKVSDGQIKLSQVYDKESGLVQLVEMVDEGLLSSSTAKEVLIELIKTGQNPKEIAESRNLIQVSDKAALVTIIEKVLSDNSKAADDVKSGELKAIGFLVGQVMKESKGTANPGVVQQLIKQQLGIE